MVSKERASIAFIVGIVVSLCAILAIRNVVIINEGHVGVMYKYGTINEELLNPGIHIISNPFFRVFVVPTLIKISSVDDVECHTGNGMHTEFKTIKIINRFNNSLIIDTLKLYGLEYGNILIDNVVRSEVEKFCSSNDLHQVYIDNFVELEDTLLEALESNVDGRFSILQVSVSKPYIPEDILKEYTSIEFEKTRYEHLILKGNSDTLEAEQELRKEELTTKIELERNNRQLSLMESKLFKDYLEYSDYILQPDNLFIYLHENYVKNIYEPVTNSTVLPDSITINDDEESTDSEEIPIDNEDEVNLTEDHKE